MAGAESSEHFSDMAEAESSERECPVCHDGYALPKILPCTHRVCCKCVVGWLSKEGNQGGCPLCRAPIFLASSLGQGDLGSTVDTLTTDLILVAKLESQRILRSPNKCLCDDSTEAKFLCLQCRIKLCNTCAKMHQKIPAIQHHVVEDLSDISAEKLAGFQKSSCSSHADETAKVYCRSHRELICMPCAASIHRQCLDVGGIKEEATLQREELKKQMERFKTKEEAALEKLKELDRQMADCKDEFQRMGAEAKATFDDLRQTLEIEYEKFNSSLDQTQDAYLTAKKVPRAEWNMHRVELRYYTHIMEEVVSASDDVLLEMMGKLKSPLDDLESRKLKHETTEVESIKLNEALVTDLKGMICRLGTVGLQASARPPSLSPCNVYDKGYEVYN